MVGQYPLVFSPIYKEMLWGGSRLNTLYNRLLPSNKTGESWDISCRPGEMGIIENGPAAGMAFDEYIAQDRAGILGTRLAKEERFPLLVKIIDANDVLSVQVHPDDKYVTKKGESPGALWHPADTGKAEMWYILTPPTSGNLIIGLKPGITPGILRQAYENGTVEDCLNPLPVKAGDIVNIPPGLIHALTPGVMVAEVQQNSDITYRLYDYNRLGLDGKPRQLHVDDAIAVADFEGKLSKTTVQGLSIKKDGCTMVYTIVNPHFAAIKYELESKHEETSDPGAFCIYTCVEGEAAVVPSGTLQSGCVDGVNLVAGRSVFIPAGLGGYALWPKHGKPCVLLKSFVPDIYSGFVYPLRQYGYTDADIISKTIVSP
ncbi:MAG: class I mannose-6-phosphate isomerase [Defluviitaleaceae bacterium]|nr:class I mannose-6-phosphate isomerase [Defluviitaleaceae bacterium]